MTRNFNIKYASVLEVRTLDTSIESMVYLKTESMRSGNSKTWYVNIVGEQAKREVISS